MPVPEPDCRAGEFSHGDHGKRNEDKRDRHARQMICNSDLQIDSPLPEAGAEHNASLLRDAANAKRAPFRK